VDVRVRGSVRGGEGHTVRTGSERSHSATKPIGQSPDITQPPRTALAGGYPFSPRNAQMRHQHVCTAAVAAVSSSGFGRRARGGESQAGRDLTVGLSGKLAPHEDFGHTAQGFLRGVANRGTRSARPKYEFEQVEPTVPASAAEALHTRDSSKPLLGRGRLRPWGGRGRHGYETHAPPRPAAGYESPCSNAHGTVKRDRRPTS